MTEGDRLGDVFAQGSPEVRVISSGSELCENTYSEFQVYSSGVNTDRFRVCVCVKQGHKSAVALARSKLGAIFTPLTQCRKSFEPPNTNSETSADSVAKLRPERRL